MQKLFLPIAFLVKLQSHTGNVNTDFSVNGIWDLLHECLHKKVRRKHGKPNSPSVGILDSQSVKTVQQGGQRGYDAAKRVKGRKRHLVVDTLGLMIMVIVHRADISERQGGKYLLARIASRIMDFSRLKVFFLIKATVGSG